MSINQVSNANTFGQLVTTVSALVVVANNLTDGPQLTSNATINLTNPGVALNISSNVIIATANVTVLTGDCQNQFEANGEAIIMALMLG